MNTVKEPRMSRAYQVLSITAIATFLVDAPTAGQISGGLTKLADPLPDGRVFLETDGRLLRK